MDGAAIPRELEALLRYDAWLRRLAASLARSPADASPRHPGSRRRSEGNGRNLQKCSGVLRFEKLVEGVWLAVVMAEGYGGWSGDIEVAGVTEQQRDVPLRRATKSLRGRVVEAQGAGLGNGRIELQLPTGDASGMPGWSMTNVDSLEARAPGCEPLRLDFEAVEGGTVRIPPLRPIKN